MSSTEYLQSYGDATHLFIKPSATTPFIMEIKFLYIPKPKTLSMMSFVYTPELALCPDGVMKSFLTSSFLFGCQSVFVDVPNMPPNKPFSSLYNRLPSKPGINRTLEQQTTPSRSWVSHGTTSTGPYVLAPGPSALPHQLFGASIVLDV